MFKFLVAAGLAAGLLFAGAPDARSAEGKTGARLGVVVTPKNFPNHSAEDVADMFRLNSELGSFSVMRVNWNEQIYSLTHRHGACATALAGFHGG